MRSEDQAWQILDEFHRRFDVHEWNGVVDLEPLVLRVVGELERQVRAVVCYVCVRAFVRVHV